MTEQSIEKDMIVADVLDMVPNADQIFEDHGVNPRQECGTAIYTMDLNHAGQDCGIDDLDELIEDLESSLENE